MTERLTIIFNHIKKCKTFADIGCDHGYISLAMLKENKAEKVVFSDISEKCLEKATALLLPFIKDNRALGVVSDGFNKIGKVDSALIAGMGGEEIVSIINSAEVLPETLIVQPMKNADRVRSTLIKKGYKIEKDFTFKSQGKFYDLIVANVGNDFYTQLELEFGRTNLTEKPCAFVERCNKRKQSILEYISNKNLSEQSKIALKKELERLDGVC